MALANIDKEHERLEKLGVSEKNNLSPWGKPNHIYKKKEKQQDKGLCRLFDRTKILLETN